MKTTWYARIRIEKNGQYGEHDGTIDVEQRRGGPAPTPRDVEQAVVSLITHHSPHLRGGRITARRIRKLR